MSTSEPLELSALVQAWGASREPLDEWVRSVGSAYQESGALIEDASEAVGATQAELEAALRLDALGNDLLATISRANPPITTWMLLVQVPADGITKALEHLRDLDRGTAFESVRAALISLTGSTPAERVTVLGSDVFEHVAAKAVEYSVWPREKNVKALRSFSKWRKSGRPLTAKQAGYALSLLTELVDAGAVKVPSPDGDEEICRLVLDTIY